jgi:hypothetical protein
MLMEKESQRNGRRLISRREHNKERRRREKEQLGAGGTVDDWFPRHPVSISTITATRQKALLLDVAR